MKTNYIIKQFQDKLLSHFSYAIVSEGKIIIIDPARNPQLYYDFAKAQNATITGVIETHPHADFVSSHKEISVTTGATIHTSKLVSAAYTFSGFDDGDSIQLGSIQLKAINTPGHSPDSICIVLESDGKDMAVFTGNTLFTGDCGRPDLRENAGSTTAEKTVLAEKMYSSLRDKIMMLNDDVLVYPAHGAGTLCAKGVSEANSSTIGAEKKTNWSLQNITEKEFIKELITNQPFIPKYFKLAVAMNIKGAGNFLSAIAAVPRLKNITCENHMQQLEKDILIIDARPQQKCKEKRFANSFNIQADGKFETWLGSIVAPDEAFYLTAETETAINNLIERIAKIGYESQIKGAFTGVFCDTKKEVLNFSHFTSRKNDYTIIDVRNTSEVREKQIFANSINIPLFELRERINEIPAGKPMVVHCAGGYRSAAGSSIIKNILPGETVYDLSEAVIKFDNSNPQKLKTANNALATQ